MRKLFYFLAMSAIVLGMAFTFNACGGNDANNPEPRRFKMNISKVSDTSCKVEIQSPGEDVFFTDGFATSEEFLKDPRGFVQNRLNAYKEENKPTYPEGLHAEIERSLNDLDPETEYVIYVCEVNEEYQAVGNVEHKRVRRGAEVPEQSEEPEDPGTLDPETYSVISCKEQIGFPFKGGTKGTILSVKGGFTYTVNQSWVTVENGGYDNVSHPLQGYGWRYIVIKITVEPGEKAQAEIVFTHTETGKTAKMVVLRDDATQPGYEYSASPTALEGTASGKFYTSPYSAVYFSKGNLQYQASTGTWKFADKQWEVIGDANENISDSYSGWIDLFGWQSARNPTRTQVDGLYGADFAEYAMILITNGGNKADIWHLLTGEEMKYLFRDRPRAEELIALGSVDGVYGLILLPDDWTTPPAGAPFVASPMNGLEKSGDDGYKEADHDCFTDNTYTIIQWNAMEAKGAVFFPSGGRRYENKMAKRCEDGYGYYQTYAPISQKALFSLYYGFCFFQFSSKLIRAQAVNWEDYGTSVRLVRMARK